MNQNNTHKNIDDVIDYMEQIYGIKLYLYQKELLKIMWTKEYIKKHLFMPRQSNIATYNLINICKILLGDKENN